MLHLEDIWAALHRVTITLQFAHKLSYTILVACRKRFAVGLVCNVSLHVLANHGTLAWQVSSCVNV